ncbi:Ger(x)C family spore germination protein [Paenibacillus antri]|uniref:Ger(X)C family spore germination protein n=1 Tax=Paenibacillus antri TaxID=2582848 RepID=A0A5R9GGS1_9BACL|nr:Ger(x)C family spore germination protein [Paenibacillus antri]TLS53626.1 Ger(x)C family spore germination protein [Paenibacillus antri]
MADSCWPGRHRGFDAVRAAKTCLAALLPAISGLLLAGCWDAHELEEYAFVTVVGVDVGERDDTIRVTYQISKPRNFASKESATTADKATEIVSIDTPSLYASRNLINAGTSRVLTLVQAKVLIVSEAFAKKGNLLLELESLVRERDFRRDIILITCRGKAEEFIRSNRPQLEKAPYRYYELITQTDSASGLVPDSQLHDFIVSSEGGDRSALTMLAGVREDDDREAQTEELDDLLAGELRIEGKNKVQFLGSAVYNDQKLIGLLTGRETRMAQLVRGKVKQFNAFVPDPEEEDKIVALLVRQQRRPDIRIDPFADPIRIDVAIDLDLDLTGQQNPNRRVTSNAYIERLQRAADERLTKQIEEVVRKSQEQFRCDFFGFYQTARQRCFTERCWDRVRWRERYSDAKVEVEIKTHIRRTGKQLDTVRGGNS